MERKKLLLCGTLLIVAAILLACNLETFTALLPAGTATPTRTPRPTFTPRATPTPEESPTPEPTATTAASPTPTQRVVATARPAPKAPTAPPAPPKPQFIWRRADNLAMQGLCPAGPGTYEIKGRIQQNGEYVGGVHVVALDSTGKIITQADSTPKEYLNPEWGVNCREAKNIFSYQLDVSAGRGNQPIIVRITRSASDLTPISPDVPVTFDASGGRFYLDWTSP